MPTFTDVDSSPLVRYARTRQQKLSRRSPFTIIVGAQSNAQLVADQGVMQNTFTPRNRVGNFFLLPLKLQRLEEADPGQELRLSWTGSVPIIWMHQRAVRTIGATSAQADLFTVVKNKWLALHPQIKTLNFPPDYRSAVQLRLSLKAEAEEDETAVMRILVSWDGGWHDDTQEMRTHLRISEEPSAIA